MAIAKTGRDVITKGLRGGDEFGEGIVGKPSQQEHEQKVNEQGLGTPSITYGGGHFEEEKAGLKDGVSARETVDPDEVEPEYNYDVDSFTGNAPERKVGRVYNKAVSSDKGKKFNIGEF